MEPLRFYRYFALAPLVVPALVWLFAWASPQSLPEPLRGVQFLIAMSVVGLPIYVPFAALIHWLLRNRPIGSHRTWSYWVPLPFALLVFAVWFLFFVLLWGVSGIYLAFPNPFDALVERLDPIDQAAEIPRLGDTVLYWLTRLHFGRWGGLLTKTLWTIFGLVPAALFITGAYMWWCRVLRPSFDSRNHKAATSVSTPSVPLEPKTPLTGTPA